jgi:hypothetical protein
MKRTITTLALTAAMVLASASVAVAGGPTCENYAELGWDNHGTHITDGYVNDITPPTPPGVRGRAAHIGKDASPGATFCLGGTPGDQRVPATPAPLT